MEKIIFDFGGGSSSSNSVSKLSKNLLVRKVQVEEKSRVIVTEQSANTDVYLYDGNTNDYTPIHNNAIVKPSKKSFVVVGDRVAQREVLAVSKATVTLNLALKTDELVRDYNGLLLQKIYSATIKVQVTDSLTFLRNRNELESYLSNEYLLNILKRSLEMVNGSWRVSNVAVRNILTKILRQFGMACKFVSVVINNVHPNPSDPEGRIANIKNASIEREIKANCQSSEKRIQRDFDIETENIKRGTKRDNDYKDQQMMQSVRDASDFKKKLLQLKYQEHQLKMLIAAARRAGAKLPAEILAMPTLASPREREVLLRRTKKNSGRKKSKNKNKRYFPL